jgi:hypothetical protein
MSPSGSSGAGLQLLPEGRNRLPAFFSIPLQTPQRGGAFAISEGKLLPTVMRICYNPHSYTYFLMKRGRNVFQSL